MRLTKNIHHPNLLPVQGLWVKNEQGEIIAEPEASVVDSSQQGAVAKPMGLAELVVASPLARKSLFERLREVQNEGQAGIPLPELLGYMADAARGIDHLGSSKIIHGDIKPHNILVVGDTAAVSDFALARAVENIRRTATTSVTVAYAAPEALRGTPGLRSDQYSLAIAYTELRTGRLPFDDSLSAYELMSAHVNGTLDLSKLPKAELKVIQRATSKDPNSRWPTACEMVNALRQTTETPSWKGFSFRALFNAGLGRRR